MSINFDHFPQSFFKIWLANESSKRILAEKKKKVGHFSLIFSLAVLFKQIDYLIVFLR